MLQYCFLVLAMPGLVIAHAFSYFTERYAEGFLYQSAPLSVFADAIVFFPLAPIGGWASAAPAPVGLEEVARPLGKGWPSMLWRVTLPLIRNGSIAARFGFSLSAYCPA